MIENARDTKNIESDVFWVTYIGAGWQLNVNQNAKWWGLIGGITNDQWSLVFDLDFLPFGFAPGEVATAIAKTALHEICHQLLQDSKSKASDKSGHRGRLVPALVNYYNALDGQKDQTSWIATVNIMNAEAIQVPMYNEQASLPVGPGGVPGAKPGNRAGLIDRYYIHPWDVAAMRRCRQL